MNKHTKMSIIVAPFLLIGGYGLMDLYMDQTQEQRVIKLNLENADCNISAKRCIFTAGSSDELALSIYIEDDITVVNATVPMYRISLFTVDSEGNALEYPLGMHDSGYYWRADMALSEKLGANPNGLSMRIIAMQDIDSYISEFSAR